VIRSTRLAIAALLGAVASASAQRSTISRAIATCTVVVQQGASFGCNCKTTTKEGAACNRCRQHAALQNHSCPWGERTGGERRTHAQRPVRHE